MPGVPVEQMDNDCQQPHGKVQLQAQQRGIDPPDPRTDTIADTAKAISGIVGPGTRELNRTVAEMSSANKAGGSQSSRYRRSWDSRVSLCSAVSGLDGRICQDYVVRWRSGLAAVHKWQRSSADPALEGSRTLICDSSHAPSRGRHATILR